jgi:hypothetical protein
MFKRFPYANVYSDEIYPQQRQPGRVIVVGNVVNLVAQRNPGKAKAGDTTSDRLGWFREGLSSLNSWLKTSPTPAVTQINFPYGIGCGLAGGSWTEYVKELETFVNECPLPVVIYKLD